MERKERRSVRREEKERERKKGVGGKKEGGKSKRMTFLNLLRSPADVE